MVAVTGRLAAGDRVVIRAPARERLPRIVGSRSTDSAAARRLGFACPGSGGKQRRQRVQVQVAAGKHEPDAQPSTTSRPEGSPPAAPPRTARSRSSGAPRPAAWRRRSRFPRPARPRPPAARSAPSCARRSRRAAVGDGLTCSRRTRWPACTDRQQSSAPAGSAAMTRAPGQVARPPARSPTPARRRRPAPAADRAAPPARTTPARPCPGPR
jgi:hypothetical protein